MKRKAKRLFAECGFGTLRSVEVEALEGWMTERQGNGMAARTRNTYLQAVRGFCKWCVETGRRRQRRVMTEPELVLLLQVARMRPLADYGRESIPVEDDEAEAKVEPSKPSKRSRWTYLPLTLDGMERAVELARERLKCSRALLAERERVGRERALSYKTLVLTGLQRNELASLTVGQLYLDETMPFVALDAADEKNRQGSTIPLRADLRTT